MQSKDGQRDSLRFIIESKPMLILALILYIQKFLQGFYFCETSHIRSFVKTKPSQNVKITMSFTDIGKSCHTCTFLSTQICF